MRFLRRFLAQFGLNQRETDNDRGHGVGVLPPPSSIPGKARAKYRFIVFCTQSSRCSEIGNFLADRWRGQGFLLTENSNATDAARTVSEFRASRLGVLLADHSAEERMNLQFADGGLLLDLPFDPMRLEQRLGRMDRMRSEGLIQCTAILSISDPTLAFDAAWHEVLLVYAALLFDSPIFPGRAAPGKRKDNDQQVGGSPVLAPSIQHHPSAPEAVDCSPAGRGTMQGLLRTRGTNRCSNRTMRPLHNSPAIQCVPYRDCYNAKVIGSLSLQHSVVIWIWIFG